MKIGKYFAALSLILLLGGCSTFKEINCLVGGWSEDELQDCINSKFEKG